MILQLHKELMSRNTLIIFCLSSFYSPNLSSNRSRKSIFPIDYLASVFGSFGSVQHHEIKSMSLKFIMLTTLFNETKENNSTMRK